MRNRWPLKELGGLAKVCSGSTPSKANAAFWGGGVPWVSAKDLKRFLISNSIETVTDDGAQSAGLVPPGTVLILVRGMTLFRRVPVGLAARALTFNQDIKGLTASSDIDPEFLAWALLANEPYLLRNVDSAGHGTGRLSTEALLSCPIPCPPLAEQRRIANVLRTWDEAIEKTERLISAKNALATGLRSRGVDWTRFPLRPIGDFLKAVSRPVPTPQHAYTALGIRSHGKGTFQRLVANFEEIDMDTVYVVSARDLIVNITFAWEGAIALARAEDDGCFVSHRFPTYEIDEAQINRAYLGYAVQSRRFIRELGTASPGGAGRNRVLNKTDFQKIRIPVPARDMQDRIARALDEAANEIAILDRQRDALAKQKRGLMQKLLTGEWSVGEADAAEAAA